MVELHAVKIPVKFYQNCTGGFRDVHRGNVDEERQTDDGAAPPELCSGELKRTPKLKKITDTATIDTYTFR